MHANPVIQHPFPLVCPTITVAEQTDRLGPIDCRELQWWFAIPRLGDHTMAAAYDTDTGALSSVRQVRSTKPATLDGQACIELVIDDWTVADDTMSEFRFLSRIDADTIRWLGVGTSTPDEATFTTVHDPNFAHNWGDTGARRLVDDGRYQRHADNSFRITSSQGKGAGVYRVTVGERSFTCLRVLDVRPAADEADEFGEAFVEPGGRTVLYRQYRGRAMDADWATWLRAHPGTAMTIDDCLYVQRNCTGRAHNVLTSTAFGMSG